MRAILLVVCAALCAAASPEQVHLARTRNVDEMLAMWVVQQQGGPPGSCVYGTVSGSLTNEAPSSEHTYSIDGFAGTIHSATMTGLKPYTRYYYQCGNEGAMSKEFSFLSAPEVGTDETVHLLQWGDMGASEKGRPIGEDSSKTQASLAAEAATGKYSLCLNVGDTSYANKYGANNSHVEDRYYREMEPTIANAPMMLVVGNHDAQYEFAAILNRTTMPVMGTGPLKRFYYSFDHGPMHVLVYSTEQTTKPGGEQWTFIKEDLEAVDRKKTPWVVAMTHHAFYCSDLITKETRCVMDSNRFRADLEDIFHDNLVDIHFAGHNHMAEMSYPTYKGEPTQKHFHGANATVYVVQGAAGDIEGNEPFWYKVPWREWHSNGFATQYSRVSVNRTHFTVDFVRSRDRSLLHTATLTKST